MLAFLLVAVLAWIAFLLWDANQHLGRTDALPATADTAGTTYLLTGSDSRADGAVQDGTEGQRADSIMLVNVAPNGQTVAVSLPRDTYVEIPGYGWDKLNAAYSYGGEALLVQTVEALSGLSVDHYVEIGMGGVGEIVDAVGGVELCLDSDVNDSYSGLVWTSGCHVADGTTALAFSRMRYSDPLGDIGRAQRQRQVVTKTISTAMSPSTLINPVSAFRLERAGAGALTVDQGSSVVDVARLVLAFRKAGDAGLTGTPPIVSLGYETDAGSAVLLEDTTAPDFFASLRAGTLTAEDLASLPG
ncbi:LCP family protein [Schaalia naturae]|uniref:LCP family protein n=1 Tax=Schaalia naturae TaxID=635203 RepID=A0ABW2SN83_9ACTO